MTKHETLAAALAAAQTAMPPVHKDKTAKVTSKRTGQTYTYEYADLASILSVVRPVLGAEGLAITQRTQIRGNALIVITELRHASGEVIDCEYPVGQIEQSHQDMGAALTYARRYALCGLIGIAADEDDDGATAPAPVPVCEPSISADQALEINDLLTELGANRAAFLKWAQADSVEQIPARKYEAVINKLSAKRGA